MVIIDLEPDEEPPKVLAIGPDPAGSLLEIIWDRTRRRTRSRHPRHGTAICTSGPSRWMGVMTMNEPKGFKTKSGRVLTDDDPDALSTAVETGEYDVEVLKSRRRGRPQNPWPAGSRRARDPSRQGWWR